MSRTEQDRYKPDFLPGNPVDHFSFYSTLLPRHLSPRELAKLEYANVHELKAVLKSAANTRNTDMVRLVADAALVACAEAYNHLEANIADQAADAFGGIWAAADDYLGKV